MSETNRNKSHFGAWLKQRRRELDLTQSELAGQIGCATDTVKKMESGVLRPSKQLAELMATFFGIKTEDRATFIPFARGMAVDKTFETTTHNAAGQSNPDGTAGAKSKPTGPEPLFRAPAPVSSLVGRVREVHAASALLLQGSTRLLTLYGPPGVGKTRLSQEIALQLQGEFLHGVCFVPLAPISDTLMVLPAIAAALRLKEISGEPLLQTTQTFLADKRLLLVLDNFEQVVDAAPVLHDLLIAAPGVKALVSSREVLKLYGEQGFPLPPLEVPDVRARAMPPLEAIAMYPAVELFVQRARAGKPDFVLSRANATDVAQICAWLDGLPLAIEMAAAHVKWMALPRLLAELSERLTELAGGMRDLSPRQQTLRGAIDWSVKLLSAGDKALFNALSIFVDGFTAETAAEVISAWLLEQRRPQPGALAGRQPGIGADATSREATSNGMSAVSGALAFDALDTITSALEQLADKSLLRCETDAAGHPRFSMFEMIHEYAHEKLAASGQLNEIGHRHARYYLSLARLAEPHLGTPEEDAWMKRLSADLSNLRAALDWFALNDPVSGMDLCVLLSAFYTTWGYITEIRARLGNMLQLTGNSVPPLLRAWALRASAALAHHQGDWQTATALSDQCLELFRAQDAKAGIAAALHIKGSIMFMRSEYAVATPFFIEALAMYREVGNLQSAATILRNLGLIAKDQGDFARAISLYEESMAMCRSLGNMRGIAANLTHISIAYYWMGQYARAATFGEQALKQYRGADNRLDEGYALENLGMIYYKQGDLARAEALINDSLDMMRDLGNQSGMAMVYTDLGLVLHARGDVTQAVHLHRQGLHFSAITDDKRRIAFCMEGLAYALSAEQPEYAAALFGASDRLRNDIGTPLPPSEMLGHETAIKRVQSALGEAAYAAAHASGAALGLGAAITLAAASERAR